MIPLKQKLKKELKSIFEVQVSLYNYSNILLIECRKDGSFQSIIQYKNNSYQIFKPLKCPTTHKIFYKKEYRKNSAIFKFLHHFNIELAVPIIHDHKIHGFYAVHLKTDRISKNEISLIQFITNYITNIIKSEIMNIDLTGYSRRIEKVVSEISTLHDITKALDSEANIDHLLEFIMKKSMALMQAEAASLMLVDEKTNELEFKVVLGPKSEKIKPYRLPVGQGISGWVAKTGKSVLIPEAYKDPRFDPMYDRQSGFRTHSMICVPMTHKSKTIGIMTALNRLDKLAFTEDDRTIFTVFASQAALSIENARLIHAALEKKQLDKELQIAAEIQHMLIPQSIPTIEHLEIAAKYIPCEQIGGDFFDIIHIEKNKYIFIVADVSGKGIPGAMLVSTMQSALKVYLEYDHDLIEIVSKLNEQIISYTSTDRYITFFIGLYDNKNSTFSFINAGHNKPLLVTRQGTIKELHTGGIFIGLMPWKYESETISIKQDDTLIMYTDGLIEAVNRKNQFFGVKKLKNLVLRNRNMKAKKLLTEIITSVENFTNTTKLKDDLTLLIIKFV